MRNNFNVLISAASLILFSSVANAAQWKLIDSSEDTHEKTYLDLGSIKTVNHKITAWRLTDYPKPSNGDGKSLILSSLSLVDYDCQSMTVEFKNNYEYSKNMGAGKSTFIQELSARPIAAPPGSLFDIELQFLCSSVSARPTQVDRT